MKPEKLFELVTNTMSPEPNETYRMETAEGKEVLLNLKQQNQVVRRTLQAFVHGVGVGSKEHRLQAFGSSTDIAQLTKDVFNVNQPEENWDLLWQKAFNTVNLLEGQLSWEICDVNSGQGFKLIPEGGKVEFFGVEGSKVQVDIAKYGMAIGITWETVNGRKLYKFWDQLKDVRAQRYNQWADVHYGLLATAGATNPITWQGGATDPIIDRDVRTLNKGAEDLGDDNKDSGYGDTANVRLQLFASPKLRSRINAAMRVTTADMASGRVAATGTVSGGAIVDANIEPNYTYTAKVPANKALLVLPGHKIQNSIYLADKMFSREEMDSMNQLRSYWTAFGAAIGDNDQVYELAFA